MTGPTTATRIVLLIGPVADTDGATTLDTEASHLASAIEANGPGVQLTAITLGVEPALPVGWRHISLDDVAPSGLDRVLASLGALALRDWAAGHPIGRLVNSLGPVDQGRVFWRTLRRAPSALHELQNADIVIATDLATIKTAWIAGRRAWAKSAVFDPRSAAT